MNNHLLMLAAMLAGTISWNALAGRTGDQLMLQERENKRVAEEKANVRDMVKRCSAMMDRTEKVK